MRKKSSGDKKSFPFRVLVHSFSVVILLSICCYFNIFSSPFTLDDNHLIVENQYIRDMSKLSRVYTHDSNRPTLMISYAGNYSLGGLNPFGYHLGNFLLHALTSIMVFAATLYFQTFWKSTSGRRNILFAFIVSLLFASNPIYIESVTYVAGRSSSLSTFFYLLSFLFFLKFFWRDLSAEKKGTGYLFFLFSLSGYIFSITSKEIGVTLPLIVTAYCFLAVASGDRKVSALWPLIPYYMVLFSMFFVRWMKSGAVLEKNPGFLVENTRLDYLLTQLQVVPFYYLNKLAFPVGLNIDIDFPIVKDLFAFKGLISIVFFVVLIVFFLRNRVKFALPVFGLIWLGVTLLPTSSIVPIIDAAVERRVYLSGFGFTLLFAYMLTQLLYKKKGGFYVFLCSVPLVLFSTNTVIRNDLYVSEFKLWKNAEEKSPNKTRVHYSMGYLYENMKDVEKSILEYRKAINLDPNYIDAWYGLGLAYYRKGIYRKSESAYRMPVLLTEGYEKHHKENLRRCRTCHEKTYDGLAKYYTGHGTSLQMIKEFEKAERAYLKAIKIDPEFLPARLNLANLYATNMKYEKAENLYQDILQQAPEFKLVYLNLAKLYILLGKYEVSREILERGMERSPGDSELKGLIVRVNALLHS